MRLPPGDLVEFLQRMPPRTAEELRALYERSPTPELRTALWEIWRLQNVLLDTIQTLSGASRQPLPDRVEQVVTALSAEPCVVESEPVDYKKKVKQAIEDSGRH